jgi:long-subunit fatty acid transport protein
MNDARLDSTWQISHHRLCGSFHVGKILMNNRSRHCLSALGAAMVLIAVAPRAGASSFSLFPEQSVTGLGVAGAGGAAAAYDASTIFYNPAGMSFLQDKVTLTVGASYIVPDITFSNHGSLTAPGSPIQAPTRGQSVTDSDNADFLQSTVPQFYVTYKYNDRLAFGLGVNSPFGVETNYNSNSVVRYNATDSRITLVNINPSISYKILPNLSLGAGINIAQRVMDCGDAGHILLSKHVADDLEQYPRWRAYLHDLGECEVKHGVRMLSRIARR